MKNAVFWDLTPCGSCKIHRFVTLMLEAIRSSWILREPHDVTSQKTAFFIVTAVKT
jgi:hypothetical protein